jgi:hypothetical protein
MNSRMQERLLRYKKDWEFKCDFYDVIDEILQCRRIEELAQRLKFLLALSQGIDGKTIFQPLRNFDMLTMDIRSVLHGLERWPQIRMALANGAQVRQVDLVRDLGMDKQMAGFFFHALAQIGVLDKRKDGRYNLLSLVTESITPECLVRGWPALFDKAQRLPMPAMLANPPPPRELW